MSYIRKTKQELYDEFINIFKNKVFKIDNEISASSIIGQICLEFAEYAYNNNEAIKAELLSKIMDPDFASGKYLDSIANRHGIERFEPKRSVVTCQVNGLANTIIPKNTIVLNQKGDRFLLINATTIPSTGIIDAIFESEKVGEIDCFANTVNRIFKNVTGLSAVNNLTDGTRGTLNETDNHLRLRLKELLYINSSNSLFSIISALSNNVKVNDFNIEENNTNQEKIIDNVVINPHSIILFVDIESIYYNEVAKILATKKSGGCGMMGNITINYIDPVYTYQITPTKFNIPTVINIFMSLTVIYTNNSSTEDLIINIKQAIYNRFYGLDDSKKVTMREKTFDVSRFNAVVVNLGIDRIPNFTMGITQNPTTTSVIIPFGKIAKLELNNIQVSVQNV